MNTNKEHLDFNVTGSERKKLVKAIAEFTQSEAKYLGAPSFAYEVDIFTIDRTGKVFFDDRTDRDLLEALVIVLVQQGFVNVVGNNGSDEDENENITGINEVPSSISIQIPSDELNEIQFENLKALIAAKGCLIKKALGTDSLPVKMEEERIEFPWFPANSSSEEMKAYMNFVTALVKMAKTQKRVTAKEKEVGNEKYAFRCFLLRLGFIGEEYKANRKTLLKNLSGSAAYKNNKGAGDNE